MLMWLRYMLCMIQCFSTMARRRQYTHPAMSRMTPHAAKSASVSFESGISSLIAKSAYPSPFPQAFDNAPKSRIASRQRTSSRAVSSAEGAGIAHPAMIPRPQTPPGGHFYEIDGVLHPLGTHTGRDSSDESVAYCLLAARLLTPNAVKRTRICIRTRCAARACEKARTILKASITVSVQGRTKTSSSASLQP